MGVHNGRAAAIGVLALVVTLSGCSGSDDASAEDGTRSVSIAEGEPDHLNPGRQTVAFDQTMALFSPLTSIDSDGELQMVVAESVESDDAVTWTITLADGWTFHDGEPVTAESYVRAWNTVAYAPNAWENNGQLANIAGYADLNPAEGEPTTEEMSGLAVVDDRTFTVTLSAPDGQFPLQLSQAQTGFYPLPSVAYDDLEAFDRAPVGNGPFRMEGTWEDDEPITVTAWADYPGEAPTVDEIVFKPYADMNTAYTDVQAGDTDLMFLTADKMTSAAGDFGDRVYSFDAPGISFLGLPLYDERYADVRVRQAISMAIDRDAVNEVIYGGLYEPATAFTPSAEQGTPVGLCGELCEYDPDAAKELLTEAGGFEGTMEIVYPGGAGLDALYEAYANQLRQNLGIADVVTKPSTDWAEFAEARTNGEMTGPFFSRWGALYPSQQNTLRTFFTPTGGCVGCVPYTDQEVIDQIAAADATVDPDAAIEGYVAAQELIMADFPAVPTFFETYNFVTSEAIADLPAAVGSPILSQIVLAEDE
ncbi:ABC transporter substrate-binding protein [uncultured Modestobacter sp.]|uniref:peptide ABC transporter substrate-binding protein n=1 Tax=uncultured Modestobacter sp. TaxID=380048 RepID=UPI0026120478|nr:ABC transporter substrate-binding protein [uncultured Modestobacter sp.]